MDCDIRWVVGKLEIGGKTVVGPLEVCDACNSREPIEHIGCADHEPGPMTLDEIKLRQQTHAQVQCPECQLWLIWMEKETVDV